jgi:recA bacterial DNA recombination protein
MGRPHEPLHSALATLRTRWGSAAVRLGNGGPVGIRQPGMEAPATHGALALAALPDPVTDPHDPVALPSPSSGEVVSTGFPVLDAILGSRGLPREVGAAFRGGPSSGKTTLALRCVASAQEQGAIAAWLDLARVFDPVEAVGRGVDLRWLLIVRPPDLDEGFSLAASLLSGRSVDMLVVDLPARLGGRTDERLRRLFAHGRRVGARLLVLEPASIGRSAAAVLAESAGLHLDLERRAWLRLGREVVGQRTEVTVTRDRHGLSGRSALLDIHYLGEGERSVAAQVHAASVEGAPKVLPEGAPMAVLQEPIALVAADPDRPRLAVA